MAGRYEITSVGAERVRAFVPKPLPPDPPLELGHARQRLLERATLALGRLDGITLLLPDPHLFQEDEKKIQSLGRVASTALRVFRTLCEGPLITINEVWRRTGLSFPGASKGMSALEGQGIVHEITGRRRGRVFAYREYLKILSEGTEPL